MKVGALFSAGLLLMLAAALPALAADQKKEAAKQLAGYNGILVEKFAVDNNPATEDFPKGLETMMQSRAVQKLREKKIFDEVVDGAEPTAADPGVAKAPGAEPPRWLILSATVLTFDKGSRAARYWGGFGAGATRIKVRFVLRDEKTGAEILRFDHQGSFKGMFSTFGGSQEEAFGKAASGVVNGMTTELEKNR